ncbi:hypothetical protein LINPERPRIM_LOCUS2888 [Linum perenne]
MTLEDFFTLTEMKDGLTVPSRVHELLAVMQKEKDCTVKNFGDAPRQWAAVGSTIAATENRDCLDLFIQLDGLWFVDRWLKEALNYSTSDGFIEESITALLRAIEKLQINKTRSLSSGIWTSVNNLIDHSSSRVQDRARALFDSWKQDEDSNESKHDSQNVQGVDAVDAISCDTITTKNILLKGSDGIKRCTTEPSTAGDTQSRSLTHSELEREQNVELHNSKSVTHAGVDHENWGSRSAAEADSVLSNCNQGSTSLKEKTSNGYVEGAASSETRTSVGQDGQGTGPESDVINISSNLCDKASSIASACTKLVSGINPTYDATNIQVIKADPGLQKNFNAKEGDKSRCASVSDGDGTAVAAPEVSTNDKLDNSDCNPSTSKLIPKGDETGSRKSGVSKAKSLLEDTEPDEDESKHSSDGDEELGGSYGFSKSVFDTQSSFSTNRRKSDFELEYGIVDALEVARQVAQEVEREVGDYREPSDTSSEKIIGSHNEQPESPDSISGKQYNQALQASPGEAREVHDSNQVNTAGKDNNELESSQVTEAAREPEVIEKGFCGFDLNEEVSSEDVDRPADLVSAPVSIVSVSRPAAASASPAAPLHFEGTLGWKGSAATSAFRPASPRKVPEGDNSIETGATSNSGKQRQDWLDIDLNVSENGDEKGMDLMLGRQPTMLPFFQRGESSSNACTGKSERANLDLNLTSDEGETPASTSRRQEGLFFLRNGHRSPSPASSSSSLRPSLRNFDLNDRPIFLNDTSDHRLYRGESSQSFNLYGGSRQGDPVISIMGAKVEVGARPEVSRKDFFPQTPSFSVPNGKPLDPAFDTNMARMGVMGMIPTVPYASSPVFGYNGFAASPAMSLSSSMYGPGGPIPYMVDSRGAPVLPQMVGSASAIPPYSQPPFIMNMGAAPLSLNGAGPSRTNFDLNSGFPIDGGSNGGLRQFFVTNQPRSFEEHLRANPQASSSSGMSGGKRKEPEGGWEPYSLHYKQPQPPWR